MRTTIDLSDELHRKLRELAAARGERGFSAIIAEALAAHLARDAESDAEVADALDAVGKLSARSAARLREAVGGWRDAWRS